jgi:hypothetical protein
VLSKWLGVISVNEFRTFFLRSAPIARPATALGDQALLDWNVVDRVLRSEPDVLVVSRGELLSLPPPKSLCELREYLAAGVGLCMRHTERHDPGLARVADAFAELGTAQVQLFVTPAGTHGFGWHYDDEEVFVAQTAGTKDYYFRANTITADRPAGPAMFARFPEETSPLCSATLVAGDFLYIPGRWWHMAQCSEDSLSLSVGVTLRTGASIAASLQ